MRLEPTLRITYRKRVTASAVVHYQIRPTVNLLSSHSGQSSWRSMRPWESASRQCIAGAPADSHDRMDRDRSMAEIGEDSVKPGIDAADGQATARSGESECRIAPDPASIIPEAAQSFMTCCPCLRRRRTHRFLRYRMRASIAVLGGGLSSCGADRRTCGSGDASRWMGFAGILRSA
jgi:hypothetical protein